MAMRISGMVSGLDTESIVKAMSGTYTAKKEKIEKAKQKLEWKLDVWKDLNLDIYKFYSDTLSKARLTSSYKSGKLTSSNSNIAIVSGKSVSGTHNLTVNKVASQTFITGNEINTDKINTSGSLFVQRGDSVTQIEVAKGMSMQDIASKLSDMGINANFDENTNRFFLSSKETGTANDFDVGGNIEVLEALGLAAATKQKGTDASITLNGAEFTSSSNNFKINDINISVLAEGTTNINYQQNNTVFDTVKDFITKYNELIEKIDTKRTTSAGKYEPLTEDEKYSMSDKQVEEWEKKIKDGILYKDDKLTSLSNNMKTTMLSSIKIDGVDYALSSFGINRGSYFSTSESNRGVYNIDEAKLKEEIEKNPNKVITFISSLSSKLYDTIDAAMRSTNYSSAYTIYNDKQIKKDITDYEKKIKEWEDKITAIEDKYYKQFATMEKMMASMQSQSSYLSSFIGK